MPKRNGKLPNFLVVGAARCGTTSLFYYLLQHPDVYIPKRKECMFFSGMSKHIQGRGRVFASSVVSDLEAYQALFADVAGEKAVGEISTDYLYFHQPSIRNIKRVLGDHTRIIIMLRNPVQRAYSHYLHHRRYGIEELSFEDALVAEPERIRQNHFWAFHYSTASFYFPAVQAYLEHFRHVKVCLYDDLERDPSGVVREIYAFLGVDASFVPDVTERYNVSGEYRSRVVRFLSQKSDAAKRMLFPLFKRWVEHERGRRGLEKLLARMLVKPSMRADTRRILMDRHRQDIVKTQRLIQRGLEHWLR